jgi:hypothetical protein
MLMPKDPGQVAPELPKGAVESNETTNEQNQDGEATGVVDAEVSEEGEGDEEQTGKLSTAAQAAVDRRIGKVVAKQKAAEAQASGLKQELEAAQAELGQLRDKVPDKAVMAAAEAAGILPQFLAKEDTELFKSADKAQTERDYWRARSREGGCTIQGREYTAEQCNDFAVQKNDELSDLLPDVKARRREISREIKTLLELGKAAKAAKWVPGAKAPTAPAAPAGGKPQAKTDDPAPARQQPPELDYDKVSSTDDLARTILAEKRQRSKGR